ncbi:MAG: hypothetical protein J0I06_19365, partial [Planctomycetes bacterium]|nr:hypothetical protein [Planctomycetota bacterium]
MTATIATRTAVRTPPSADPTDRGRAWLARLFAGDFSFPTVSTGSLPPAGRSAAEHDAVSRAAGCRDLFVIHSDPAAGERAIADLARCVADRVLILSPDPAAADRVTERLLKCGESVLRALADDENPTRPSAMVSRATSRALGGGQVEQVKRAAAGAVAAAEQRVAAFAVVAKAVARLAEVNDLSKKADADVAEQTARRDRVEADVADEAAGRAVTAFTELIERRKADHDAALAGLIERHVTARKAAEEKDAEVNALRQQLAGAAHKGGFFGRLFHKSKPVTDVDEVRKHLQASEAELAALTAAADARQAEAEA